jgi:hypothetical protein
MRAAEVMGMVFGFKRNKTKHSSVTNEPQSTPADNENGSKPEPPLEFREDVATVQPVQYWNAGTSDWIGEMYKEQLRKGSFDDLPGKGKPLEIPSGDVTNSILKNANVLPHWLTLQHEIRDQLHDLLSSGDRNEIAIQRELDDLNRKVSKYNGIVPSVILQKRKITKEEMQKQYHQWV